MLDKAPMTRLTGCVLLWCLWATGVTAAATDLRLVEAVKKQDKKAVQALLQERIDVNAAEIDGTTALHWAAYRNDRETVAQLIKGGANVRASNRYGVQPLSIACLNGERTHHRPAAEGGRRSEHGVDQRRNGPDDRGSNREHRGRDAAARRRRRRQRAGELARPDRVDVGGRRGPLEADRAAGRARRQGQRGFERGVHCPALRGARRPDRVGRRAARRVARTSTNPCRPLAARMPRPRRRPTPASMRFCSRPATRTTSSPPCCSTRERIRTSRRAAGPRCISSRGSERRGLPAPTIPRPRDPAV